MIAFSAGLTGRDHAEVRALHMSWFARLVDRRMSEKRPEERILEVENTSMLYACHIVVTGMKEMK